MSAFFISPLIPIGVMVVGVLPIIGLVQLRRWAEHRYKRESPLARDLLRPPGHSLRAKIDDLSLDIDGYLVAILVIPVLAFAAHVSQSYFAGTPESGSRTAISILVAATALMIAGWQLLKLLQKRKWFIIGWEGELATAEELNQLMLDGCRVFHDIPFQYGNIDHVVVSRSGVYAVNTKTPGKPKEGNGRAEVVIDHKENVFRFPDHEAQIPGEQIEGEAKWLSTYLTSSVARPITVEPMLALPGWYIKERIGRGSVYVINPIKPQRFFVQNREVLNAELIQQVAHQLEQLCRVVEPSYKQDRAWAEPA